MQKLTENLKRTPCHFGKPEIESLSKMFDEASNKKNKMDRNKFRDFLHKDFKMTDDILMDRVFKAFDRDNDSYVSAEEWVRGLSTFMYGSLEERTKFCFDVYDLNGDSFISREEMFQMLKSALVKQSSDEDPDEGIKDLVELCIKKMDHDGDLRLSFSDFQKAVQLQPLLLECFGPCLPNDMTVKAFRARINAS